MTADSGENPVRHRTAMLEESIFYLNCREGGLYVDCTFGGGGHSRAILDRLGETGRLIALDQDAAAVAWGRRKMAGAGDRVQLFHTNFVHLDAVLEQLEIPAVDGIIADLGISQYQIAGSGRGFSFSRDEPLDMRMDSTGERTAAEVVNGMPEERLRHLFKSYGEERWASRIAREIIRSRRQRPIRTSRELSDLICRSVPRKSQKGARSIHPATRVFMALRIFVNNELENLSIFLETAPGRLAVGGRLCVLSFHSLEDRMVKHRFKDLDKGCRCPPSFPICTCGHHREFRILTRKVCRPTPAETEANPMARSTRLRAIERIAPAVEAT